MKVKTMLWVLFGVVVAVLIAIPTASEMLDETSSRISGEGYLRFEELKAFCGWVAREAGETELAFRLRSFSRAVSAKVGASLASFALLGSFALLVWFVFRVTESKKTKTEEAPPSSLPAHSSESMRPIKFNDL